MLLKGLGYLKLTASFLVAVYYMIYISLASALLIWTAKGPIPLTECRELHRGLNGYQVNGTSGQKCLNQTFLKSIFDDPLWYGIVAVIIFTFWLLVPMCLMKLPHSFQKSMYIFGGVSITLYMCVVILSKRMDLRNYFQMADWKLILSTKLWYAAFVQVLFSTHIGFGYLITSAGTIYEKSNVIWSSVIFVSFNLFFGWVSVFLWHQHEESSKIDESSPLMVLVLIYDSAVHQEAVLLLPTLSYSLLISSGLTSVLAFIYPIVWCIRGELNLQKSTISWLLAITGVFLSLATFVMELDIIKVLDHEVIPVCVMITLLIEFSGLLLLYGFKSIKKDVEFVANKTLSYVWFGCLGLSPTIILFLTSWKISSYFTYTTHRNWTFWLMIILFGFAIGNVILWASWVICHKEDYGFLQKLKSAAKPSRKWGPVDPIIRHRWLQYKTDLNTLAELNSSDNNVQHNRFIINTMSPVVYTRCNPETRCCATQHQLKEALKRHNKYMNVAVTMSPREQHRHSVYNCEMNFKSHSCWIKK